VLPGYSYSGPLWRAGQSVPHLIRNIRGWISYYSHFYERAPYPTLRSIEAALVDSPMRSTLSPATFIRATSFSRCSYGIYS